MDECEPLGTAHPVVAAAAVQRRINRLDDDQVSVLSRQLAAVAAAGEGRHTMSKQSGAAAAAGEWGAHQ